MADLRDLAKLNPADDVTDVYQMDAYRSKWLVAAEIEGSLDVEILNFSVETFRMRVPDLPGTYDETRKIVLELSGADKRLVLNKTQVPAIVEIAGSKDPHDWIGTPLRLTPEQITIDDRPVNTIRITRSDGSNGR